MIRYYIIVNHILWISFLGSVTPETLRDRLKRAMKLKDRQALEKAIEECVASGHPELLADVQQARDVLDSIGGGRKGAWLKSIIRFYCFSFFFFNRRALFFL